MVRFTPCLSYNKTGAICFLIHFVIMINKGRRIDLLTGTYTVHLATSVCRISCVQSIALGSCWSSAIHLASCLTAETSVVYLI